MIDDLKQEVHIDIVLVFDSLRTLAAVSVLDYLLKADD